MPRKRSRKSSIAEQLVYSISVLLGIIVFFVSFFLLPLSQPVERLAASFVAAAFVMFFATILLAIIVGLLTPKKPVELTFDEPIKKTIAQRNKAASEFEYEIASMINQLTGKKTQVVGGAGDGGVDIKVYDNDMRLVGIVQCKRIANNKTLSPSFIRELNAVKHHHQVNTAYLVTTGRFSQQSYDLAQKLGVRLIDGEALKSLRRQMVQSGKSTGTSRL